MAIGKKDILIDSTYLLPLVGIKVLGLSENPLGTLINQGFNVKINQISLFEAIGKALREAEKSLNKEKTMKRIEIGIKSILLDTSVEKFPVCEVETIGDAIRLYESGLDDLPDCFITVTASVHTGLLLTESKDIETAAKKADIKLKLVKWKDFVEKL